MRVKTMLDRYIDPHYEEQCECLQCEAKDRKMQDAAYWLKGIAEKLTDAQLEDVCDDLDELCGILGVRFPREKLYQVKGA